VTSFLGRVRIALARTARQIQDQLVDAADRPATAGARAGTGGDSFDAIEEALVAADVGLAATTRILEAIEAQGSGTVQERVVRVLRGIFDDAEPAPEISGRPHVVLVVGVNGTGKTTTVGKLARLHRAAGRSVLVGAADTYRAAAVDQLVIWAERAQVDVVRAAAGADPAAVAFDAVVAARARDVDVVLIDTAGRLHTRANLMAELDKIRRVVGREVEGAPHDVLLVLDATVGQNGVVQAREFMTACGANGIVLTKLDGTAKGGVAVAIAHELRLPIRYLGVGEGSDDLVPFDAADYIDALFVPP
jgi:fused signal recognition particle receptor